MQESKYLVANERDALWGLTVSTVGYDKLNPGDPYPTRGHAGGYYFSLERILHLVYTVAAVEVETEHEVGILQ